MVTCCRFFSSSSSSSSFSSSQHFTIRIFFVFHTEEIRAYSDTYLQLVSEGWMNKISERELLLTVMNCKLDPKLAVSKYKTWLTALKKLESIHLKMYGEGYPWMEEQVTIGDNFPSFEQICSMWTDIFSRTVCWVRRVRTNPS